MSRAVIFAYHDVGVRCLEVLLAHGVDVPLVVTHRDNPQENVWFGSVAERAELYDIPVIMPTEAELPALAERLTTIAPDFIFSFYYRYMLSSKITEAATRGALNIHGSLLPRYRGRAPVNWAVLNGESETGASLHYMTAKPDAGDLVGQQAVPILLNDTAVDVMTKVTCAAELCLDDALPGVMKNSAPRRPLDLSMGSYFGRRRPEDGRVDWRRSAWDVHNLIRAVAPPYPGAFTILDDKSLSLLRSHFRDEPARHSVSSAVLYLEGGAIYIDCPDGKRLRLLEAEWDGTPLTPATFESRYSERSVSLD